LTHSVLFVIFISYLMWTITVSAVYDTTLDTIEEFNVDSKAEYSVYVLLVLVYVDGWWLLLIAVSNVINKVMHKKTEVGRQVRSYLLSGDVIPDKLVFDLMTAKLASAEVAHQGMYC